MVPSKPKFWKLQNFLKKIYRKRSLFLAALLFTLSTISPVVAKVSSPTPVVQSQQDAGQLVSEATQLYRSGQFQKRQSSGKNRSYFCGSRRWFKSSNGVEQSLFDSSENRTVG